MMREVNTLMVSHFMMQTCLHRAQRMTYYYGNWIPFFLRLYEQKDGILLVEKS